MTIKLRRSQKTLSS